MIALVFELEISAAVKGNEGSKETKLCMGFQIAMPELAAKGMVEE